MIDRFLLDALRRTIGRRSARSALAGAFAVPVLVAAALAAAGPPATPVRPVVDTYFGVKVADPYRWLENLKSPEVQRWFKAQSNYSGATLQRLDPARTALRARISALSNTYERVTTLVRSGDYYFYLRRPIGADTFKLYARPIGGSEVLIFDPERAASGRKHFAINFFSPSLDGSYVAFGVSEGGSEATTLRVARSADASLLKDAIDRTEAGAVSWRPGSRSFYYNRLQALAPGAPPTAKYQRSKVFVHELGRPNSADVAVFGYGLSKNVPLALDDIPALAVTAGSPYVLGLVFHGVQNEVTIYLARQEQIRGAATPWRKIVDTGDKVVAGGSDSGTNGLGVRGSQLYVLAHKRSPNYEVGVLNLERPHEGVAPVVEPSSAVVRSIAVAKDALYVTDLDGGSYHLRKKPYAAGSAPATVAVPFEGWISGAFGDPRYDGALFSLEGWTHAPAWYRTPESDGAAVADLALVAPPKVDFNDYVADEVQAKSYDGTLVPLSIVHRKDLVLDGSHPAILDGYGAYGITIDPVFAPRYLAWLERGGVWAEAHVRGGGEFGEAWHTAGKLATKKNTWLDFIACAQYLIDRKYTSPQRLAGEGTSAGGITIGRAITTRPDLFAAANINVGSSNTLRAETGANGPPNIPEFGSVKTKAGFQALYEMDGYQHVKNGTPYPGVIVTTGINDPRVDPWEPAKIAARLQAATSSGKPVLLRVDYDAGHGIGSTKSQYNDFLGDVWSFYLWQAGDPEFAPK
jgi:prolyl oligopeptidase